MGMKPYADRLKKHIRKLASARGWTLERAGQEAGLGRSYFFAIVMGTKSPSLTSLKKISDAFKVDVTDLLKR